MSSVRLILVLAGAASTYGQSGYGQEDGYGANPSYGTQDPSQESTGSSAGYGAASSQLGSQQPAPATAALVPPAPSQSQQSYPTFDSNAVAPILNPVQGTPSQAAQPAGQPALPPAAQPVLGHFNPLADTSGGSTGGQMNARAAANPMAALMGSVMGQQAGNQYGQAGGQAGGQQEGFANSGIVSRGGQVNSAVLSTDSQEVVSGLIEAFMHKIALQPGEKKCLETNVGQLTGDIMGTVADSVTAIKALIAGQGQVQQNAQGPLVSAGLDSVMKITGLVTSVSQLVKGCVHGDALAMLKETAHHFVNGTYLQHRFLVNGVDIAHDLADAIVAFERHDFRRFGTDIGTSLRKILLSDATHATRLPEGVPEQEIIQQTTQGLMAGFFVTGSAVDITDTAHPDVDIHIDLHQCIDGNREFFKEIWLALWDLIAKLSAVGGQHELGHMFTQQQGQPKWAGELMIAMMQFPMALSKCGVSANMQSMLMEAIKTLNDLKVHFQFPDDRIQTEEAADKMALAVKYWTNWNFKQFGYELGKLFRELVMLAFPQKYSIGASGRLQVKSLERKTRSFSSPVMIISGASITLLLALAVVRTRRSLPQQVPDNMVPMTDIDVEAVE